MLNRIIESHGIDPKVKKQEFFGKLIPFSKHTSDVARFEEVKKCVERIFEPKVLTFEIGREEAIYLYRQFRSITAPKKEEWNALTEEILAFLHLLGYRDEIRSHQEYTLMGATRASGFKLTPYAPLSLANGKITLEEAKVARTLLVISHSFPIFYNLPKDGMKELTVTLEPLDPNGNAEKDPRVLDIAKLTSLLKDGVDVREAIEECVVPNLVKSADYPYRRD